MPPEPSPKSTIPAVAELGLVAITNNDKIRTNPVEARIALECGARIVGLEGKVAQHPLGIAPCC